MAVVRTAKIQKDHSPQLRDFPGDAVVKKPPANPGDSRDKGLIPGSGRSPGIGNGNPLQYFSSEKFHGQGNLVGCSPWGSQNVGYG